MAPQSHIVVTLRLPKKQLESFDFSDCKPPVAKKPRKRPAKPRARGGPASGGRASEAAAAGDEDEDGDAPAKKFASVEPRGASAGSGIISGGGGDPILGNLPRSVKAAPVANTSGLDLDKTPCRKWTRRPIQWKSFTGFTYNVTAWCSDYKENELAEKIKREAELDEAGEKDKTKTTRRAATPKAAKPKARKPKAEPGQLPVRDSPDQPDDGLEPDAASEPASELLSEPPSEPPSEAASMQQTAAAPSELNSEL